MGEAPPYYNITDTIPNLFNNRTEIHIHISLQLDVRNITIHRKNKIKRFPSLLFKHVSPIDPSPSGNPKIQNLNNRTFLL